MHFFSDCDMSCFRRWVELVFNIHSIGDTDCDWPSLGCELVWFLICTCLVIQTVVCLVSECEFTWFLICTLLVTDYCLSCFRRWIDLVFNAHSSADTDCGLACFRGWVSLAFNLHSSGDCSLSFFRMWVGFLFNMHSFSDCGLSFFRQWVALVLLCTLLVTQIVACLVSAGELAWVFIVCSCGNIHVGPPLPGGELLCFCHELFQSISLSLCSLSL